MPVISARYIRSYLIFGLFLRVFPIITTTVKRTFLANAIQTYTSDTCKKKRNINKHVTNLIYPKNILYRLKVTKQKGRRTKYVPGQTKKA